MNFQSIKRLSDYRILPPLCDFFLCATGLIAMYSAGEIYRVVVSNEYVKQSIRFVIGFFF